MNWLEKLVMAFCGLVVLVVVVHTMWQVGNFNNLLPKKWRR